MSRRMFSSRIINSARFLQMSEGSQLLYFHLGMRADDDGIVEAWPVMKMLGTKPDDFKVLMAKEFVLQLNAEQVIFIKDWNEHNTIRADRKVNSVYIDLLKEAVPEGQIIPPKARSDVKDNSARVEPSLGGPSTDGVSKDKISKDNKHKDQESPFFRDRFWPIYPKKVAKKEAVRAMNKLNPDTDVENAIVNGVERDNKRKEWKKNNGAFIPYPATYINGRRWEDEIEAVELLEAPSTTVIS